MKQPGTTLRAHQIIEGLEGKTNFLVCQPNLDKDQVAQTFRILSKMLTDSQKFLITEDLPFPPDGEKMELIHEATNLPADCCFFERRITNSIFNSKSLGWGALCVDSKLYPEIFSLTNGSNNLMPRFACFIFFKLAGDLYWSFLPFISIAVIEKEGDVKVSVNPFFQKAEGEDDYKIELEKSLKGLSASVASEIMFFLQMLSCSNVTMQIVDKPHALNKKRAKKNLPPLDSYHILKLPMYGKPKYEGQEHSDRNSPRLHFRRGHVRRLSPEQLTWVSHCMVGDASRGTVEKHYQAGI